MRKYKEITIPLAPGLLALLAAAPLAMLIYLVHQVFPDQAEKAVLVIGVLFAAFLALPPALYILMRRRSIDLGKLGLIVLVTICVLLVSVYFYRVRVIVLFPADFLIWSESEFVNDILKFRLGYPIYSAEVNNESFIYTPGAQMLTYLLAWLSGKATSIPLYRVIQLGYSLLAAIVAVCCCRRLIGMTHPARRFSHPYLWGALSLPFFFLIATNFLTNPYAHNLHNDSLGLLVSAVAYWLLLIYTSTRDRRVLALMALIPTAGFLVKQSLAIWALLYCVYLLIFDRPRSLSRLIAFTFAVFGVIGLAVAGCYLMWGDNFFYWVVTVPEKHGRSFLRSFQHMMDVWSYFVIGLFSGLVLLRGKNFAALSGPWLIWLFLILAETSTSGIGWMLNHLGPGSLIAGIWFIVALFKVWPLSLPVAAGRAVPLEKVNPFAKIQPQRWLQIGVSVAVIALFLSGLGVVRIPVDPFSADAYRYVSDIEKEFEGQPPEDVLLDSGTWMYLKGGVLMKDRVTSIGDRGFGDIGDFSHMIHRLEQKRYAKILVRNLHAPEFWYDHYSWSKSSKIKQTLLNNYREVGRIEAVSGRGNERTRIYLFGEISILAPNPVESLYSDSSEYERANE
jgi:hypothetical protein